MFTLINIFNKNRGGRLAVLLGSSIHHFRLPWYLRRRCYE
jgi:hypothetical protein